jgi:hypothetical protein
MDRGLRLVRPLEGGLDAWAEAGFDVDVPRVSLTATGTWRPG